MDSYLRRPLCPSCGAQTEPRSVSTDGIAGGSHRVVVCPRCGQQCQPEEICNLCGRAQPIGTACTVRTSGFPIVGRLKYRYCRDCTPPSSVLLFLRELRRSDPTTRLLVGCLIMPFVALLILVVAAFMSQSQ